MSSNVNIEFFDEYKRLDKLCSDIYCKNSGGVTSYIDDMTSVPSFEAKKIPKWSSTYDKLKTLRYIRNQMAHGECSFNDDLCSYDDVQWLKDFQNKIMNVSDPLAIYRQNTKAKGEVQHNKQTKESMESYNYEVDDICHNKDNHQDKKLILRTIIAIITTMFIIILILLVFFILAF